MTQTNDPAAAQLQQDWQMIWQSEMAAKAVDREMLEGVAMAARTWSALAAAFQECMNAGHPRNGAYLPGEPQPSEYKLAAGPRASAGSTPARPAPDAREPEIERLTRRVAELERRLAELDRPDGPAERRKRPGAGA